MLDRIAWKAAEKAKHSLASRYWDSIAETATDILKGISENPTEDVFTLYKSIEDEEDFAKEVRWLKENYGLEIGIMAGTIIDKVEKMKEGLV